jgi:hypothetical protein
MDTPRFLLVRGPDLIHVGLDWSGFRLELGASGARPHLVAMNGASVTLTFPPQVLSEPELTPAASLPLEKRRSPPSRVQFAIPAGTWMELNSEDVLRVLANPPWGIRIIPLGRSGEETTAIVIPWALSVSVTPRSGDGTVMSDHPVGPITSPSGVSGLWRARLRASSGSSEEDAGLALIPRLLSSKPDATPLSQDERSKIVQHAQPGSLPSVRRLELSTLGGSLSVSASWSDFEWDHEVVLGRDQKIRTQLTGILYPFGHQVKYERTTERVFSDPPSSSVAGLVTRSKLFITEPVRGAPSDASEAREFPFSRVEILARSFDIESPSTDPWEAAVFVPELPGGTNQPVRFPLRCAGASGDVCFDTPLVFIAAAHNSDLPPRAERLWRDHQRIDLPGVPIDLVRSRFRQDGDVHEVHSLTIVGVPYADAFRPKLIEFTAELPVLRALKSDSEPGPYSLRFTQDFLDHGDQIGLPLELVDGVQITFTSHPDRSGGLIAPRFRANKISRTMGVVPGQALQPSPPLLGIYRHANLLGLSLGEVIASDSPQLAPAIVTVPGNPPGAKMLWEKLRLKNCGPFKTTATTNLTLTVENSTKQAVTTCSVENFAFDFPADDPLVTLDFGSLVFTQVAGHPPKLQINELNIEFKRELKLIGALAKKLLDLLPGKNPAFAPLAGSGKTPTIKVTPEGLTAGYAVVIDQVPAVAFTMRNIAAHLSVNVPFGTKPVTTSLGFGRRDNPFNLSVLEFGGGGYIDVEISGKEITCLDASMEFGAVAAVNLIVVKAEMHALGGVHFLKQGDRFVLDAFLRFGGCVEIFGVVSISVELKLALAYHSPGPNEPHPNSLVGRATLWIEVDVLFISESVKLDTGDWVLVGGAAAEMRNITPFFASHQADSDARLQHLLEYYEAFAR